MGVGSRLVHAYNAFLNRSEIDRVAPYSGGANTELGVGSSSPARLFYGISGDQSIKTAILARIAIDAASVDIRHVKLDDQDRYVQDVKSGLHNCLNVEANVDQSGRSFLQEVYHMVLDVGHVAVIPVDMSTHPANGGLFDIMTMRVGYVTQWYPRHVRVNCLNDKTGRHEEVVVDKRHVAIYQNPMYAVMNAPNSTLQRLLRKLALLDIVDEQTSSGKLDLLIQLPYPVRNEARREDAKQRKREIEFQLKDSQYGIAYIDAQEKVTQLNRPIENNLLKQVDYLMELAYSQLGITKGVMNGTAPEEEMLNYHNRSVEPLIGGFVDEMRRKFLTKTARTQGHSLMYFRDPFKLVPMKDLAELADKFTRNEIVTANEFRGFIGMRPSADPKADMLINSNLTVPQTQLPGVAAEQVPGDGTGEVVDGEVVDDELGAEEDMIDSMNKTLDEVFEQIGVEE